MIDPITAEIIRNYMESVSAEIIKTMVRTSVSPIFNEAHDCSAGVFYYDGEEVSIVSRADAVPVHIYATLTSVQECLDFFHGDLSEGDVIIVSDPYYGGTHIPDYTVVKPVFYEGQPMFFPAVRGHVLDAGGPVAGGTFAREVWHEGFRFPPVKLYEKGHLRREVWDLLMANNRVPDLLEGDLGAMIGGCRVGEQRIGELCAKYGLDTVRKSVEWIFDYSERAFREQVSRWPDGTYTAESTLDSDLVDVRNVQYRVALTIRGDEIEADFEGTDPQTFSGINSPPGNTLSYLFMVFSALCPEIPINSGFFRPLTSKLPVGTVVNPTSPGGTGAATVLGGCDIGEVVMKACEQFAPERTGTATLDLADLWAFGTDRRTGDYSIHYDYYCSPCSSGGTHGTDGWGAFSAPMCALVLASVEVTEFQYPCLYRQAELTTDSAAPGQWRGSPAFVLQREIYGTDTLRHTLLFQGLVHPLYGYAGGRPGAGNYAIMRYGSDDETIVHWYAGDIPLDEGEVIFYQSCGGGGWGEAQERDPAAVLRDVLDEYVSLEGALHDYGVVIDPASMAIDPEATERKRAALREKRLRDPEWMALGRRATLERAGALELVTGGAPAPVAA
ncbi:MAG: hydantoinase B/oxoprolinase family protein [Conexibacter sp.]